MLKSGGGSYSSYDTAVNYCRTLKEGARLTNSNELASIFYNKYLLDLQAENFYWAIEKYSTNQANMIYFNSGRQYNWGVYGTLYFQCVKR